MDEPGDAMLEDGNPLTRRLLWVVWPAFLVACVAWGLFFSIFDPHDLHWLGQPLEVSRETAYTVGFLAFWAMAGGSSALTVFLARSPWQVNRCPLPARARPDGCPKQETGPC